MLTSIRKRVSTPAGAIAVVALVFALGSTALAASGALSGKQKKEVEKIAKKFAGKPGAAGATGPAGTNGTNGTNGAPGKNGTSVTSKPIPTGIATCGKQGGTELTSASGTEQVCNGATGFTKTLPSGETETGAFAFHGASEVSAQESELMPISFPIPLAAPLDAAHVHYIDPGTHEEIFYNSGEEKDEERAQTACLGSTETPTAKPGNLCIYRWLIFGPLIKAIFSPATLAPGAGTFGGVIEFNLTSNDHNGGEHENHNIGSWAVTAP